MSGAADETRAVRTGATARPWSWHALRFAAIAGSVGASIYIGGFSGAASATPGSSDLATIVLSSAPKGFVTVAPGPRNGPITSSNIGLVVGGNKAVAAQLEQDMTDEGAQGYIRVWDHEPLNGDAIVIEAFEFPNAGGASSYVAGAANGLRRDGPLATYSVPGVTSGTGLTLHVAANGSAVTEYAMTFEEGEIAFDVQVVSATGDLSRADALRVATSQARQAARSPLAKVQAGGATGSQDGSGLGGAYQIGEIVGYLLVAIAIAGGILVLVRESRKRSSKATQYAGSGPPGPGVMAGGDELARETWKALLSEEPRNS